MQDVVADTMSTEVIDKSQSKEEIHQELASIQVLARLSFGFAIFIMGLIIIAILIWRIAFSLKSPIKSLSKVNTMPSEITNTISCVRFCDFYNGLDWW
jgi:uncharacterized membrane protein